jgi:hypothetical protein
VCLVAHRLRRREVAGDQMDACLQVEREWQHGSARQRRVQAGLPGSEHEPAPPVIDEWASHPRFAGIRQRSADHSVEVRQS